MRATDFLVVAGLLGLVQLPPDLPLPPLPEDAPAMVEVEGTYRAMIEALRTGDHRALRHLTHSSRRHLLPSTLAPLPAEEARQFDFCRPTRPLFRIREEEIAYLLVCEAAGERVEQLFLLRRDRDEVWRIIP
jgi:hypothetical protein